MLYLIENLHQTTTLISKYRKNIQLYLIENLHQTTTLVQSPYERPQLYLIENLHQTTTEAVCALVKLSCILLKIYIKPQHVYLSCRSASVVSY